MGRFPTERRTQSFAATHSTTARSKSNWPVVRPPEDPPEPPPARIEEPPLELDLHAAGIGTVLWATGFRPDLSWIELPLADEHGWPRQSDGLTEFPGLAFVGLQWLRKRKSALLLGVGEDAEVVVSALAAQSSAA